MIDLLNQNKINIDRKPNLDDFHRLSMPSGSLSQAATNDLYGINHTNVKSIVPEHKDGRGFVFFTRPQLKMTDLNLARSPELNSLLDISPYSLQRYVRCMLDPRLLQSHNNKITCPLVDNRMGFIPPLTNSIKTLSGWPDLVLPTFQSKEGIRKEQYMQVDGVLDVYKAFDIDCVFSNTVNKPIALMMQTWLYDMALTFEGVLSPYMDMIVNNEIDYNTRIYSLVTTLDGVVSEIGCCGAAIPITFPSGKTLDYDSSKPYKEVSKDLNMRFSCVGFIHNTSNVVKAFNQVSYTFNPGMRNIPMSDYKPSPLHTYDKIPQRLAGVLKNRGYPLINTNTMRLEWWIDTRSADWSTIMKLVEENNDGP